MHLIYKKIQACLHSGDFWTNDSSRSKFISELAVFCSTSNMILSNSTHYKAIGITTLAKYENFKQLWQIYVIMRIKFVLIEKIYEKSSYPNHG